MSGIEIERFKVNWMQLLSAAALIGAYGVTMTFVVNTQSESTKAIQNLNDTMTMMNSTVLVIESERKHDRADIREVKLIAESNKSVNETQQNQILELQIVTGVRK